MKRLLIAAAAAILTLSGCSQPKAIDPNLTAAGEIVLRAAIRHAVADYISSHGVGAAVDRAARAVAVLDDVLAVVNGDQEVTLESLRATFLASISSELTPLEQADAKDVLELVGRYIHANIGEGKLNGAAIVKVRDVLDLVRQAAALAAPPA
jgi:hypothetical protein